MQRMERAAGDKELLSSERESALEQLEDVLEVPMNVLAVLWLALTVIEFTNGLSPFLEKVVILIWTAFWFDFLVKLTIAPSKLRFLSHNWLTLLALILPALRIFRAFRAFRVARFARGGRLVKVVGTFNRGMRALRRSLRHRGFGYVIGLTLIVNVLGAAGIYAFEKGSSDYLSDFGTALWWTAMMLTTMGSDYFPKTSEGRLLALLLAIYGFAVFGYVTAMVASFFVERDASSPDTDTAGAAQIEELKAQIELLTLQIEKSNSRSKM